MKKFLSSMVFVLLCVVISFAQAPKGINYQGVARDNEGNPLASKTISVRISILKTSANGEVEYAETHKPVTNQFGLFTLVIGQGTKVTGDFAFISWAIGNKWLQIEMDPNGGSAYTLAGSQQLMTVPYAFYAEYTGSTGISAGQGIAITSGVVSNTGDADNIPTNELQNLADVLTKSNNAGTIKITNLGAPTDANDAATKNYVDALNALDLDTNPANELQDLSQVLTMGTDAGGKKITNLGAPTAATDAATKSYVDTQNALDLDQVPTNELQNLAQVLSQGANANDAGTKKITNLGTPTLAADATTKAYVDNAIAANYAFKVPYSYTYNTSPAINKIVDFGTDIYDDFNVTNSNRFITPSSGYYMFFIDGNVNNNNIILSIRVNSTTIYQATKSEERIGTNVFINHGLSLMLKLSQNDFVELVVTSNTPGDNLTGALFGYKL